MVPNSARKAPFVIPGGWRLTLVVCVLFLVLPPALAHAWTRYRYASGYTGWCCGYVVAQTSGYTDRQYNAAYRADPTCDGGQWTVRYYDSVGNITWQARTLCSPTQIGLTTGPRRSYCDEYTKKSLGSYAYNCDTTIP
jgi:hypothetical protein